MSEIINKYIADRNVDDLKILLRNNQYLLARNAADDADISIFKVTASDFVEFFDVPRITRDAIQGDELVRLSQIQNLIDGLNPRASVDAATTANISLSGAQTIDGVAVLPGDSVLVKDQINQSENGIYTVQVGLWSRRTDSNTSEKLDNSYVFSKGGTANVGKYYLQVGDVVNLGVDAVIWDEFNSNAIVTAGDGIDVTAGIISVDINIASGLKIDSGKLSVEPNDFAGFGLEDDGLDNLRLASSGFGDGLTGGSGIPVAVQLDSVGGANIAKSINLSANGLAVKVDDVTISENGTGQLQVNINSIDENYITTSIAGNGLSGGNSLPLAVNVDDSTIEIVTDTLQVKDAGITEAKLNSGVDAQTFNSTHTALNYTPTAVGSEATTQISAHLKGIDLQLALGTTPSAHAITHISGGTDEIASNNLASSYVPVNYTRTVNGTTVTIGNSLGSHLLGIDNALGNITTTFENLSDTTFTSLTNGEVVVYSSGTWINQTLAEAGIASTTHASTHITAGSDEIDGDELDIDWNPTNYTPITVTETTTVDSLSSHLKGIDDVLATIPPLSNAVVEEFVITALQITNGIVLSNLAVPATVTVLVNGAPTQFNSNLNITDNGIVTTVAFDAGLQAILSVGNTVEIKYLTDVGSVGVGSVSESRAINTDLSLTGGGDLSANRTLTLLNDTLAPGSNYYYGTNNAGSKGWFLLPAAVSDAVALNDVSDVVITTPVNNELLAYDNASGNWINQTPTEAGFAIVATSGDYGDLINTPTNISTFTNDSGYLLPVDLNTFAELQALVADATIAKFGDNVSQFTNDSNYITAAQAPIQTVNSLTGTVVLDSDDLLGNRNATNYTATTANTITQHLNAIDTKLGTVGTITSINGDVGPTVTLIASEIDSTYTPTNYTQANATIDGHLDGINTALNAFQASSVVTEQFTLIAGDLTNGYIDLSNPAAALIDVVITGLNEQFLNSFTLTTPVTNGRVTWSAGIASQLSVGNVIEITYIENVGIAGLATNSHATTHESGGSDEITGSNLELTYASTNYTPTSNTLGGHVEGINTVLGNIVENPFELQDIVSFTGASDLLLSWANDYVRCTSASAVNVTVQPVATIAHTPKTVITIRQAAAGQVTLVAGAGVTLNVRAAEGLKTAEQHAEIQLTHVSNDVWDIRGGIA